MKRAPLWETRQLLCLLGIFIVTFNHISPLNVSWGMKVDCEGCWVLSREFEEKSLVKIYNFRSWINVFLISTAHLNHTNQWKNQRRVDVESMFATSCRYIFQPLRKWKSSLECARHGKSSVWAMRFKPFWAYSYVVLHTQKVGESRRLPLKWK